MAHAREIPVPSNRSMDGNEATYMDILLVRPPADAPWRSRKTCRLIETALRTRWSSVHTVRASSGPELRERLWAAGAPCRSFVFNTAAYLDEKRRRGYVPGLLELLGFPHLGSSAAAVRTTLDKGCMKRVFTRRGIPTPRYFVAAPGDQGIRECAARVGFPVVVKPNEESRHAGIGVELVARDMDSLERAIRRILLSYRQPSLVEELTAGGDVRDFGVGVIGGARRVHLPFEIDRGRPRGDLGTLRPAASPVERIMPIADRETAAALNELADSAFDVLGASDYARVDIRGSGRGLSVLAVNTMPGLGPRGFMSQAAADLLGFDHGDMICMLARESIRRQAPRKTA